MFKRLFSLNNPLGIAISAAAIILTLSPEARKGTRKVLVKGAAALLSVGDQVKGLTVGARKELGSIVEEAKVEKEQMVLPDFSELMMKAEESTKSTRNSVFDDMKFTSVNGKSDLVHAMEMDNEFIDTDIEKIAQKQPPKSKKAQKKIVAKINNNSAQSNAFNVLSDKQFNSIVGKEPPIQ